MRRWRPSSELPLVQWESRYNVVGCQLRLAALVGDPVLYWLYIYIYIYVMQLVDDIIAPYFHCTVVGWIPIALLIVVLHGFQALCGWLMPGVT